MTINNPGRSCEDIQAKLKAEIAGRERLAKLEATPAPPAEAPKEAIIEVPNPITDDTAAAPEINFEDPARLEFEALPDEDLKALATKHGIKSKSFDRNKLIDTMIMRGIRP